jgi:predicted DNA-binding transcriptional regulator AlpA
MLMDVGVLMGQAEIADRLGVTRQRVQQLIARADWPEPYEVLAMGKVWRTEDIEAWIKANRPEVADQEVLTDAPVLGRRHGSRSKRMPNAKNTPASPPKPEHP